MPQEPRRPVASRLTAMLTDALPDRGFPLDPIHHHPRKRCIFIDRPAPELRTRHDANMLPCPDHLGQVEVVDNNGVPEVPNAGEVAAQGGGREDGEAGARAFDDVALIPDARRERR